MRLLPFLVLLIWLPIRSSSLPLAPPPPDFIADFSKREVKSDLMAVVDEDELQNLRHNGFQEQLRHLREKNIGRDPAAVTEEMAMVRNSVEDISEFSLDSSEVDEAINDITVPTDAKLKKSSKFTELAQIHNPDSSNNGLPPFAFSEDEEGDPNVERIEKAERVEVVPPIVLVTMPSTPALTTTVPTTTASTTTTAAPTTSSVPVNIVNIDSDVENPRRAASRRIDSDRTQITTRNIPIEVSTTTLPTTTTTKFSPPSTTPLFRYTSRTQSPHIFSSSTVRLPSAIPLASTSGAPRAAPIMTTPRPYRGGLFTTEFTIEPVQKRSEGPHELRDRIRSTSQLLNLLGDRIEGIDQQMSGGSAPKTGVLTNIYDQGIVKRRNYRTKQWGKTGKDRQGLQTYDGQFTGMAYGATKQKGGGYSMRKKMVKRPWAGRGYKTRRLGERRPDTMRPSTFLEKKTTEVSVEPYGAKRRGEWIRGVKLSERRSAVRKVSETQKSLAQALMESEEASMRQLKNTLRQIRDVVRFKTSSTTATLTTSTPKPVVAQPLNDSFFKGQFDWRR